MNGLLVAGGLMAVLGLGLSSVLALANKRLHVYEDPRIDAVDDLLPQANCGACGFPGCRAFAEALVAGAASPAQCTVNSAEAIAEIAAQINARAEDIGARRLHTVLEKLLEEVSFTAPDVAPTSIVVDEEYVKLRLHDLVQDEDLSRYIL